jgi:hypothetical protein
MNNLDVIRSEQFSRQVAAVKSLNKAQAVEYSERDPVTGQSILYGADGGKLRANYLSGNEPEKYPLYIPQRGLGEPGFMVNR